MSQRFRRFLKRVIPYSMSNAIRHAVVSARMAKARAKIMLHKPLKRKRELINFGVNIAEHCNLNCAGCDHFSPLAEHYLMDVDMFRRDIERMSELFNHEAESIGLLGGEPLLHPDIAQMIGIVRKNFPVCKVTVITNGIILSQNDMDTFWTACRDNNANVEVTRYPIKIDVERIKSQAGKYGVKLVMSDTPINSFFIMPVNVAGTGNERVNFGACVRANKCISVNNGKIYNCTFAPDVKSFNRAFKTEIPVTPDDYIDIYAAPSGEYILQRLSEPIPLCKYCSLFLRDVDWRPSKREMSEWL